MQRYITFPKSYTNLFAIQEETLLFVIKRKLKFSSIWHIRLFLVFLSGNKRDAMQTSKYLVAN
ncbi:MAG: hypothetical protein WCS17_10060, partial [Prevotella sp.]